MKKFKIKPSTIVLNLVIVLVLSITLMISPQAAGVEYVILNMGAIVWLFAQLDLNKKDEFRDYWIFITIVAWVVITICAGVYVVVKINDLCHVIGDAIDEKFGNRIK